MPYPWYQFCKILIGFTIRCLGEQELARQIAATKPRIGDQDLSFGEKVQQKRKYIANLQSIRHHKFTPIERQEALSQVKFVKREEISDLT